MTSVLLIDDHPVVLQGVRHLLAEASDFEVIAECTSADEGLEVARGSQPDLVVLDLRIGDRLAPDVCFRLRRFVPGAKVVILTAFDDSALLQACLQAGAAGVLLKDTLGLELVRALRRVRDGEQVLDERLGRPSMVQDGGELYEPLTPREHEILGLMARGLVGKEIANELNLAPNTVRSYAQSVLSKLHARSRVQALATAKRLRLL